MTVGLGGAVGPAAELLGLPQSGRGCGGTAGESLRMTENAALGGFDGEAAEALEEIPRGARQGAVGGLADLAQVLQRLRIG